MSWPQNHPFCMLLELGLLWDLVCTGGDTKKVAMQGQCFQNEWNRHDRGKITTPNFHQNGHSFFFFNLFRMKTLQLTLKLLRCSVRWHAAAAAYNCSEFMTWKFGWSSTREPDYPYQWRAAPLHDITIFFDKGKQLILSKWTNHKSAFPGKSSLSSREQDRQGDDTKTLCLFHFPFLWGILEVLVKLYCNGVMIQVSTWCFSTALLCSPVSALWAEPWFFTCAAHLISIDGNQWGCA